MEQRGPQFTGETEWSPAQIDEWLKGCPYSVEADRKNVDAFRDAYEVSRATREKAVRTLEKVRREAQMIFEPFQDYLRSELVAESNRIEGYDWTPEQVRTVTQTHGELLSAPLHMFMTALRDDRRVIEALGLYRAHILAEQWVACEATRRPLPADIRAFHAEIAAGESYAGEYKRTSNCIGGSRLKTAEPVDVPWKVRELTDWWEKSDADPVLRATVIHAWLTHIHPFEDGNGRMARLLANLELAQSGHPPMIIREQTDRGWYYDALAASDDGDILPLYALFSRVLRRTVATMSTPAYVQDVVHKRFLQSVKSRHLMWSRHERMFFRWVKDELHNHGWTAEPQGVPDVESFSLLCEGNPSGNCWYMKLSDREGRPRWLLWFGFNSPTISGHCRKAQIPAYPSVFLSFRDHSPGAHHPYRRLVNSGDLTVPSELMLLPGKAVVRWNDNYREVGLKEAAKLVSQSICRMESIDWDT